MNVDAGAAISHNKRPPKRRRIASKDDRRIGTDNPVQNFLSVNTLRGNPFNMKHGYLPIYICLPDNCSGPPDVTQTAQEDQEFILKNPFVLRSDFIFARDQGMNDNLRFSVC